MHIANLSFFVEISMMKIADIIARKSPSQSVSSSNALPWHQKEFSHRMLQEHLSQEHDMASRNLELIKKQVDWINNVVLKEKVSKVLDLCCGPGLYTNMLAKYGHRCKGIDFSPAAIEYAHITKIELMLDCEYSLSDIRYVDYGKDFDLTMLLFGEFNTKTKLEASGILKNANLALKEGGLLLLELIAYDTVEELGSYQPTWLSEEESSFSSKPHIILKDYEWVRNESYSVCRYNIIHSENQQVDIYTERLQAYSYGEYEELLAKNGFSVVSKLPALANEKDSTGLNLFGLLVKKTA